MRFLAVLLLLAAPARAEVLIRVDKDAQRMTVSVDGQPRHDWPVSTGTARYDTPNGRYRPLRMARRHFSREWDDAPMPHAIFFTGQGHAIHGSGQVRRLGRPASHGCVRLAPGKAAALFRLVTAAGPARTRIAVEGSLPGAMADAADDAGAAAMSAGMQMGLGGGFAERPVRRRGGPAAGLLPEDLW